MTKNRTFCVVSKLIFLSAYLNSTVLHMKIGLVVVLRQENGKFGPWGAKFKMAATKGSSLKL